MDQPSNPVRWIFASEQGPRTIMLARWLWLRALAAIYFSAFFALMFQVKGLIGEHGILPAGETLAAIAETNHVSRFWLAPSLFWISSSTHFIVFVMWIGLVASIAAFLNLWPRASLLVCFVCFLAFVSAAADFSGYQSDGMLLEAGFISLFFAPPGLRPRLGVDHPPIRLGLWLLQWEWFRIYFESGLVKWLSGDPQWRHLTAMDEYYQNSPLPSWVGWYVQHLPHWFQKATAGGTLILEFFVVLLFFFPRKWPGGRAVRVVLFAIVTLWEIPVILTGNYAFLNYIVLCLGILLLDDRTLASWATAHYRNRLVLPPPQENAPIPEPEHGAVRAFHSLKLTISTLLLALIAYNTSFELLNIVMPAPPLPSTPVALLEPFRIANQYGLFAVMTSGRYEIEFQGSNDGQNWTAYPFRYKPQVLNERPRIYAPYQPRFDWNLWFASLGDWQQNEIVPLTEERLLDNDADVLDLFRGNPFAQSPPKYVRAVLWQYWFTTMAEKEATGNWWKRNLLGLYAPVLIKAQNGHYAVVQEPEPLPSHT
ncbi:MAG TPA: lipase maturation factor family protein [Acidobacteriaceae bacterium]|nr:lipase maturation factor family protein [Acidobacteriaceae bacterium]